MPGSSLRNVPGSSLRRAASGVSMVHFDAFGLLPPSFVLLLPSHIPWLGLAIPCSKQTPSSALRVLGTVFVTSDQAVLASLLCRCSLAWLAVLLQDMYLAVPRPLITSTSA